MPTPSIQTLINDAQQVLNLDSISAVRSVVAVSLANANTGTPLNPNLTTQQLWNEFYQVVPRSKSDIESIIANQLMKFLYSPPAPGGVGADKQVIFNDGGVLAGDPQFLWDKTANLLSVTGSATISGDLTVDTNTLKVTASTDTVTVGATTTDAKFRVVDANYNGLRIGFFPGTLNYNLYDATVHEFRTASVTPQQLYTLQASSSVWYDGAGGTRMTLNSSGLKVGTTSNQGQLTVGVGSGLQAGTTTSVAHALYDVNYAPTGDINTRLSFVNSNGATNAAIDRIGNPYFNDSGNLAFLTKAGAGSLTERMRITSDGNVGIGVTPSAWASIYKTVEFANGSSIWGQTDIPQLSLQTNAFLNSSFQWIYKTAAAASNYRQTAGEHLWFTAPSGTAGNVITFTERLRLKETGQLRFVPLAADPAGAEAGDVYYNSTSNKLKCYNGTTWNDLF